jgi:GTP-binding protein
VSVCREDGRVRGKITVSTATRARARRDPEAGPGDIIAIAGLDPIGIGDTVSEPRAAGALKRIQVDEPTIAMVFGVNTSPFAAARGSS